jgi:hypothetical protein
LNIALLAFHYKRRSIVHRSSSDPGSPHRRGMNETRSIKMPADKFYNVPLL